MPGRVSILDLYVLLGATEPLKQDASKDEFSPEVVQPFLMAKKDPPHHQFKAIRPEKQVLVQMAGGERNKTEV